MLRGEGPVKHYVESFFRDYPRIREGQGVLDDWATPLDAYVRAAAFRIAGLGPTSPVEARLGRRQGVQLRHQPADIARALRFRSPALRMPGRDLDDGRSGHSAGPCDLRRVRAARKPGRTDVDSGGLDADRGFARRSRRGERSGPGPSRPACARAWPCCRARPRSRCWRPRGSSPIVMHGRRRLGPLLLWGVIAAVICLPWAWATFEEYGTPFYSYTSLLRIQLLLDDPSLREREHASLSVLHAEKPARDRAGQDQVADPDRRLLDHDRRPADRGGLLHAPRPARRARATRPTCWSRRSAWCSCWRRSRASPT